MAPMATAANNTATLFAVEILGVIGSSSGKQAPCFGGYCSVRDCRHKVKRATLRQKQATLAGNKADGGQKSCMETSALRGRRSQPAAQMRVFGAGTPIDHRDGPGRPATAAFQVGTGKQLGQPGFVSGRKQGQPIEHAGDRGPSRRQRSSLT